MKRLSIFLSALFAVALISSVNPQSSFAISPNQNNIIVKADTSQGLTGTVIDATTGKTVSGATVTLEGQDQSATTNSAGTFKIDGVSAGNYQISVTANGYKDFEGKITVGAQMQPLSIKLTPKMSQ
jgi:hypothetical protein